MLKKVSHIVMVLLLLVATTGLTVSKHFCQGSLVDVNIFGGTKTCCDDNETSECCDNEFSHFELDENFVIAANDIELQEVTLELLFPFIHSIVINEVERLDIKLVSFNPPPPQEVLDFLSDIQVYRL
ncbi:hypothetical protein KEM09_14685 [Carboxylicivirga mesophila]|uniref:Uncharacterized protein n=1 Tax=Carboxylicivirga mesophila TaxID=1166478 RepID=A0ABS5KCV7_9BACT|nr:hypothetical protein [Carboxylicivirga mesophila]MBS2212662.1 hypothetical protein [Carboxylicivirga mesophila]